MLDPVDSRDDAGLRRHSPALPCLPLLALALLAPPAPPQQPAPPTPAYSLADRSPGFGAITSAGDVDGDQRADLLVLTPSGFVGIGGPFLWGRLLLLSGGDGRSLLHVGHGDTVVGLEFQGGLSSGQAVGDVDGDGHADLLVDRTYILSVTDERLLLSIENDGLDSLDDFDDDGWRDFVIVNRIPTGVPPFTVVVQEVLLHSALSGPTGTSWTYDPSYAFVQARGLGRLDGDRVDDVLSVAWPQQLNEPVLLELRSGADGAVLASRVGHPKGLVTFVQPVGDLDGDDRDDVLVGLLSFATDPAAVVLSGLDLQEILAIEEPFDAFATVGDLTGDGVGDYLLGVTGQAPEPGRVDLVSGADHALVLSLAGPAPAPGFGAHLAALGDVTDDNLPDFAVTTRAAGPGQPHAMTLFSGATLAIVDLAGGSPSTDDPTHWWDDTVAPVLTGTGTPQPGHVVDLRLVNGEPGGQAFLVLGTQVLPAPPPALPWLVPAPQVVVPLPLDAQGTASLPARWPPSAPAGLELLAQGWIFAATGQPSPWRASNALRVTGR